MRACAEEEGWFWPGASMDEDEGTPLSVAIFGGTPLDTESECIRCATGSECWC